MNPFTDLDRCKETSEVISLPVGEYPQESSILSNPECSGSFISACDAQIQRKQDTGGTQY